MEYISTRGQSKKLAFSEAVSEGLAPDGGLYVPASIPDISGKLASWEGLTYPEVCFEFLKIFADDIPEADLKKIVDASYKKFDDPRIASRYYEHLALYIEVAMIYSARCS